MVVVVPNTLASRRMVRNYNLQVMRVKVSSKFCPTSPVFDKLARSWNERVRFTDYSGPRCEFLVQYHTDYDLQFENGGTCFFGDEPTTTLYNNMPTITWS